MTAWRVRGTVTLLTAAALACDGTSAATAPVAGPLDRGTWGGTGAGLIVDDSTTHLHVGCTFGTIPVRVSTDAAGRFERTGSYVLRAYPVQLGPALPATFRGERRGDRLTVSVTVRDTMQRPVRDTTLGPVSVVYRVDPTLGPCPICARPARRTTRIARPAP